MKLTWYGHSFFKLETSGKEVLVDPFIEDNPVNEVSVDDFNPDIVAVTHGHFDHISEAHKFDTTVIGQPEVVDYITEKGHDDTVGFNIGGTYEQDGISFTMVHSFHSSGSPENRDFDVYGGTAAGYIIEDSENSLYHAGDTGLFGDMKDVIRDIYEPNIAAVPIGDHFTMGTEEAATAVDWLGVEDALPMHYNTFPPIEQDPEEFAEKVKSADIHILEVGEEVEF